MPKDMQAHLDAAVEEWCAPFAYFNGTSIVLASHFIPEDEGWEPLYRGAAPAAPRDDAVEAALKATWEMVDPLRPPGAPGSYARGSHNGICDALKTFRDNYERELRARPAAPLPEPVALKAADVPLPALPVPYTAQPMCGEDTSLYTADQMHAHAAAVAAALCAHQEQSHEG